MVRMIPWSLPPVKGGSVGGYTPKVDPTPPTPEPVTNYPYDLSGLSAVALPSGLTEYKNIVVASGKTEDLTYYSDGVMVRLSGVEILDSSNVSSVIAYVSVPSSALSFVEGFAGKLTPTFDDDPTEVAVDVSNIFDSVGGDATPIRTSIECGTVTFGTGVTGGPYSCRVLVNSATEDLTLSRIVVYNSNGVPLQEWEPSEE